jgi:hypothetical protein
MMTREDVLKELELWPLWTLRQPLAQSDGNPTLIAKASVVPESQLAADVAEVEEKRAASEMQANETQAVPLFQGWVSEDGHFLMLHAEAHLLPDENTLLQNISIAMRIKFQPMAQCLSAPQFLAQYAPKVVITFGEHAAQAFLQSTALLQDLRGHPHHLNNTVLIATYALPHLLQHWQDKAKAWEDLCLALAIMEAKA